MAELVTRRASAVVVVWLAAAILGLGMLPGLLFGIGSPSYGVDGSGSARAQDLVAAGFPGLGSEQELLVLHSDRLVTGDPDFRRTTAAVVAALRAQPGVVSVGGLPRDGAWPPRDPASAYALASLAGDDSQRQARIADQQAAVGRAARDASEGRVSAALVGPSAIFGALRRIDLTDLAMAEAVGVPIALAILVLGLRTLGAALVPLGVAGAILLVTFGVLAGLGTVFRFDAFLLIAVTTIGLGVGIDYSLLVLSRHREELAAGTNAAAAAETALATSGRTVLCSGLAVMATAATLLVVRAPIYREFALGTILVVGIAVLAAHTLLPAALVLGGRWLERGALPCRAHGPHDAGGRWAGHLVRHPWPYALVAGAILLAAAVPALDLRLGLTIDRRALGGTASGSGLVEVERAGLAGAPGSLLVLVQRRPGAPAPAVGPLVAALRADRRVAAVAALDNGRNLTLVVAVPRTPVDSPQAAGLVRSVRGEIVPRTVPADYPAIVGGGSATLVDIQDEASSKLPWVIGLVAAASFLVLVRALRSLLLPVKAVVMNLLATAATYGVTVLVFQGVLGQPSLEVYLPLAVFTVLFGLSTDYEMFLVRRIREDWLRGGDTAAAVASGLRRTARPIALAAAIMVALFASLLTAQGVELRQAGFALAVAIGLDATLVRLLLVPALMRLLGRWNWWHPDLPGLRMEGPR